MTTGASPFRELAGSDSGIIEQLAADHRGIQNLLDRVRSAPPGSDERTSLVEQASCRLVSHLVAEKERLYPLVHRYVVDGDKRVNALLAVDEDIQRTLESLEAVPARSERYVHLLLCLVSASPSTWSSWNSGCSPACRP
ncbi:hemerythrin domain-containing protein [Streptomyces sp. NPDC007205]|uniref:hemerythrin domain-containing protein n=1 Tax=Streptomyces sp. NPDC007205 TaxID=3154316 RepID=UPI0033E868CE